MPKSHKRGFLDSVRPSLILEAEEIMDRLAVGSWTPNVDICETPDAVTVRVELPGIQPSDIRATIQNGFLRVHGVKREPASAGEPLSYYCLERRYGRFDRQINIDRVVDARRSKASLANGILTVEIPKVQDRRGVLFEVPVVNKQK